MKKKILIVLVVVLVLVAGVAFFYLCNGDHSTVYYTVIDNSRVEEQTTPVSNGAGSYKYRLDAYDADGNIKNLTFKASRELRQGAYLKLEVMPIRGVISWEEVHYEELPETVKGTYLN